MRTIAGITESEGRGYGLPISEGNVGLMQTVERFEPETMDRGKLGIGVGQDADLG